MKSDSKKSQLKVYIPLIIVIVIVLAGCWYWYRDYSRYISSDDARIDSDSGIAWRRGGFSIKGYAFS
jgi:multidrug resistance efflux pump